MNMDVECPFTAEIQLMGESSGSAFLASVAIMDGLGLTILWFPFRIVELEVLLNLGLGGINLAVAMAVLTSRGMELSLTVHLTSLGVRIICAPLRDASATISFGSTVWRAPKVYWIPGKSSMTSWSIGQIAPWMIFGTNQLLNNFCGGIPLVV